MNNLLLWIARLAGSAGALLTALTIVARLGGTWYLGGVSVGTLLLAGIAGMVLGCLGYLAALVEGKPAP
jgi:hypothetical protein